MKTNDRVKFNHKHLKTIQAPPEFASMEGTIKEVVRQLKPGLLYVRVLWDGEQEVKGCLSSNLAVIKSGLLMDATE